MCVCVCVCVWCDTFNRWGLVLSSIQHLFESLQTQEMNYEITILCHGCNVKCPHVMNLSFSEWVKDMPEKFAVAYVKQINSKWWITFGCIQVGDIKDSFQITIAVGKMWILRLLWSSRPSQGWRVSSQSEVLYWDITTLEMNTTEKSKLQHKCVLFMDS